MNFLDCKVIEYSTAWEKQQQYFNSLLADPNGAEEVVMLCEHPHVYTLGKNGEQNNLLVNDEFLAKIGATYFKIDRGGDITYHGYGQLVAYPILNLNRCGISLKQYIHALEQAIIDTVAEFGIEAARLDGAAGVWVQGEKTNAKGEKLNGLRKIAAIGVKASRFITMHGMALNVNTDLQYFSYINPCGFVDKGVTSMAKEIGEEIDMERVKTIFQEKFRANFEK